MPVDNKKSANKQDNWWQKGLMMFAQSTGWIAVPVIGALFLGNWLDQKYQTKPLYFLSLTILAFIISCIGIGMTGIKYIKEIDLEDKNKNLDKNKEEDKITNGNKK